MFDQHLDLLSIQIDTEVSQTIFQFSGVQGFALVVVNGFEDLSQSSDRQGSSLSKS